MSDHWLGEMPALPLARGVPVVDVRHRGHRLVIEVDDGQPIVICTDEVRPIRLAPAPMFLRVDLDDPQGFAYALRLWWCRICWNDADSIDVHSGLMGMWRCGRITDADRLAMARALAEAYP